MRAPPAIARSFLLLVSAVLAVGLLEVGLRLTHFGEANQTPLQKLMDYDPLLGWRHRRNTSAEIITNEYRTMVHYNTLGVRGRDRPYRKPQNISRIVVLGDSFVDGYTVPVEDQLTEILEAGLGRRFEVINLGVTGYSTDQELLLLEQEGWKYQPDFVVLAFYYNDVWGNGSRYFSNLSSVQKPLFVPNAEGDLTLTNVPVPRPKVSLRDRLKIYGLIRNVVRGNGWLSSVFSRVRNNTLMNSSLPEPSGAAGGGEEFTVYQQPETEQMRTSWTVTQALLRKMKKEAVDHNTGFVVFYVPTRIELSSEEWSNNHLPPDYHPAEVADTLAELCRSEGVPLIEPSQRFKEAAKQEPVYYRRDPHWNAAGHHLAGHILEQYFRSSWEVARQ